MKASCRDFNAVLLPSNQDCCGLLQRYWELPPTNGSLVVLLRVTYTAWELSFRKSCWDLVLSVLQIGLQLVRRNDDPFSQCLKKKSNNNQSVAQLKEQQLAVLSVIRTCAILTNLSELTEIVEKVKMVDGEGPFRPTIPTESCPKTMILLMERCWSEDPNDRPDASCVIKELRIVNGGKWVGYQFSFIVFMRAAWTLNISDNRSKLLYWITKIFLFEVFWPYLAIMALGVQLNWVNVRCSISTGRSTSWTRWCHSWRNMPATLKTSLEKGPSSWQRRNAKRIHCSIRCYQGDFDDVLWW